MADTNIEWADRVWNPTTGCDRVSPGCDHCYALTMAKRLKGMGAAKYQRDGDPRTSGPGFAATHHSETVGDPLRWRKPARVFVNSMSDLFHDDIPDGFIAAVWATMTRCPQHTFMVLTKRHARMRSLLSSEAFEAEVFDRCEGEHYGYFGLPLPNVWLGVSAENQQWADIRIPALLETPAAVRFVSAEPLLGYIDLFGDVENPGPAIVRTGVQTRPDGPWGPAEYDYDDQVGIDWVIAGGESGPGARPMHPNWARGLRDQCQTAGVAFLFKQRGEWTWNEAGEFRMPTKPFTDRVAVMHGAGMMAMTKGNAFNPFERGHPHWVTRIERVGKARAGRELDGRTWDEFPEAVVR